MNTRHKFAGSLALALILAGCGDSGGGTVASTPTPTPTPTPTATYTKIADMSGDRTFQTGGIQYQTAPNTGFTNGTGLNFGSGVTVAYTASSDTYRVTAPDGSNQTFSPVEAQPPAAGSTTQTWIKNTGTIRDQFSLTVPSVGGVPLSYTIVGNWGHIDTTNNSVVARLAVGGAPTIASDMPKTGSANYATAVGGTVATTLVSTGPVNSWTLAGNSSATFAANFGTGQITTTLNLAGTQLPSGTSVVPWGTYSGTGTINSGGPGFSGTLSGTNGNGLFSGAFLGPQALEMGFDFYISNNQAAPNLFTAVGAVIGVKQ